MLRGCVIIVLFMKPACATPPNACTCVVPQCEGRDDDDDEEEEEEEDDDVR